MIAAGIWLRDVVPLRNVILRPGPPAQPELGTYPSGHVTAVAAIGVTTVLLCGTLGGVWRQIAVAGVLTTILLISASRIVLAEHWLIGVVPAIVGTVGIALLADLYFGSSRPTPLVDDR